MPSRKPYHNSPYDDGGMPLGTTTADYDNADEVRKNQVKSTYEPAPTLFDMDYQPKQFTKKETGLDEKKGLPYGKKGFNSAIADGVGIQGPDDFDVVDIEDPANRKELLVTEALDKGFEEVPELPKTEKEENVEAVKEDIADNKGEDFLKMLEDEHPQQPIEVEKANEAKEEQKADEYSDKAENGETK